MFIVNFGTNVPAREITRKSNAIKVAERDGAVFVLNSETNEVVWGEKPAAPKAPKTKTGKAPEATTKPVREMRPYRLDGHVAAADRATAENVIAAAGAELLPVDVELVAASSLEEGDKVYGTRARNAAREVAEMTVGKKWVTLYDEKGRVFGYFPVDAMVPRVIS